MGEAKKVAPMKITPNLFSAYLKCPMKSWLQVTNAAPSANAYAEWLHSQENSYFLAGATRLQSQMQFGDCAAPPFGCIDKELPLSAAALKDAKWQLAINVSVVEPNREAGRQSAWNMEPSFHAIERIPSDGRGRPAHFVPIRFSFQNKIDTHTRILLAFDAAALSELLGRSVTFGKIIHGEGHTTIKMKTAGLASQVQSNIKKITTLLQSNSPPGLTLNRHCPECRFAEHCRTLAVEKDDLSLLSSMSEKECQKHRAKGIFTVTQLSYTFRPRRRA